MTDALTCRYCGAPIVWERTERGPRPMNLDFDPADPRVERRAHFATCTRRPYRKPTHRPPPKPSAPAKR